jgi:hypothetical protein
MNASAAPVRIAALAAAMFCLGQGAALAQTPLADRAAEAVAGSADERRGVSLAVAQESIPSALTSRAGSAVQQQQTMLWARRQALSLGVGVEQRSDALALNAASPATALPSRTAQSVMVGMQLAAGERTSFALQTPVWTDRADAAQQADAPRMALRSRDSMGDLKLALSMKMQLAQGTNLSVRPRKGGLGVTLRSQW